MGNSRWYRLGLSILLLAAISWLWVTRFDELLYHTMKSELVDIGDATSFRQRQKDLPANSYVRVHGVLGNKAATLSGLRAGSLRFGRYQVRNMLGSNLYIEFDETQSHGQFQPFQGVSVAGRLTPFGPDSELHKVRTFFATYYNQPVDDTAMLIVVDEEPRSQPIYAIMFLVSIALLSVSFYSALRQMKRKEREHHENLD